MKNFAIICLGAVVGVASAQPVAQCTNPPTCETNMDCCREPNPYYPNQYYCTTTNGECKTTQGMMYYVVNQEGCQVDKDCWSMNCVNRICLPSLNADKNIGDDCEFDMECFDGWCKPDPDRPKGVCKDRCESSDPPKWKACPAE